MIAAARLLCAVTALGVIAPAGAQDLNIPFAVPELEQTLQHEPLRIVAAEISRPKAKGDITLKADVSFGERPPLKVKLRKAEPGAESFNNVPRYDLAAYELQKLFIEPAEYVVPPTALRMVPIEDFRRYSPDVEPTFRGSDEVLGVLQVWLQEVKVVADVLDPALFESDAVYARHIGQLNVFTFLIEHGDSNVGNFLVSRATEGARVFSIDNGVAFASGESDRGKLWQKLRVKRLPADTVERLRGVTENALHERLGTLAQWQLQDGRYVPVPPDANLAPNRGVRKKDEVVQLGLTRSEILAIWRQRARLLQEVDAGRIATD
jgi:hypothetical protein